MAITIAEMRAKLAAKKEKASGNNSTPRDNSLYPHWKLPTGGRADIRIINDGDPTNDYYWRDYSIREITFNGVKGVPETNGKVIKIKVPAFNYNEGKDGGFNHLNVPEESYFSNKEDPIQNYMSENDWYNTNNELYKRYKRKMPSHLYQGFVRKADALEGEGKDAQPTERLLKRFIVADEIHKRMLTILDKEEVEKLPTDPVDGYVFTIHKKQGQQKWADYKQSEWNYFKTDSLTEAEVTDIKTNGIFELKDFLLKKPNAEELVKIVEMFEDSMAGLPYDFEKFGKFYKPFGVKAPETTQTAEATQPAPTVATAQTVVIAPSVPVEAVTVEVSVPKTLSEEIDDEIPEFPKTPVVATPAPVVAPVKPTTSSAHDILAAIKAKKASQ